MTDEPSTVLLLEDDDRTITFLAANLRADGFVVLTADRTVDALRLMESKFPDLVVLDVHLPDGSGLEVLRRIREADGIASRIDPHTPVVVLSGHGDEVDRLRGFERGADDYLAKPFSYAELLARMKALLRRSQRRPGAGRLRVGTVEIDPAARAVQVRGEPVELSAKEFALLRALASEPTRVFTKDELLRAIWGYRSRGTTRTLDSHACRLRQKLGAVAGDRYVVNVWGVGYRLMDGPVAP